MTIRAQIERVLRVHGPMKVRTMRVHGLKQAMVPQYVADLVKGRHLVKLGGGGRSFIYGLPGQKLPMTEARPA